MILSMNQKGKIMILFDLARATNFPISPKEMKYLPKLFHRRDRRYFEFRIQFKLHNATPIDSVF